MTDLKFTQALLDRWPGHAISIAHRYPLIPEKVSMPLARFVQGYSEAGLNKPNSDSWMPALELLGNTDDCVGLPVIHALAVIVQAELTEAIEKSVRDTQAWSDESAPQSILEGLFRVDWMKWLETFKRVGFGELCGNNEKVRIQAVFQLRRFLEGLVSNEFAAGRSVSIHGVFPATAAYSAVGSLFQFENAVTSAKIWLESGDQRRISLAASELGYSYNYLEESLQTLGLKPKFSLTQLLEKSIKRIRADIPKPI